VLFFWRLADIGDSVARESYLGERVEDYGETRWLRLALAYTEMAREEPELPPELRDLRHRQVRGHWLEDQAVFFKRKVAVSRRQQERCLWPAIIALALGSVWFILGKFLRDVDQPEGRILIMVFLVLIMLAAGLEAYYRLAGQAGDHQKWLAGILAGSGLLSAVAVFPLVPLPPGLSLFLSVAGISLLGLGGFLVAYLKLSAHAENARRYEQSGLLFSRALMLMTEGRWPEPEIIAYLGRQALAENSAWLRQHLERPINLPIS
jgi:hypothetical protein